MEDKQDTHMKIIKSELPEVLLIEPKVFGDKRGYFTETYNQKRFFEAGIKANFVQDDISKSEKGALRGLHYQHPFSQEKLIWVNKGEIFDVVVDIRKGSKNFGKWVSFTLSEENHRQLFIPHGFAHGFCVLSDEAILSYKCSDFYHPEAEHGVIWNDPEINIDWPSQGTTLSQRDLGFPKLADIIDKNIPKL